MQENNKLWLEIKEMFETSQTEVMIFNGAGSDSAKICDMLRVTSASAMGAVMLNTSGVVFDDWIRLYGGDTSDRVGISKINLLSKNGTPEILFPCQDKRQPYGVTIRKSPLRQRQRV